MVAGLQAWRDDHRLADDGCVSSLFICPGRTGVRPDRRLLGAGLRGTIRRSGRMVCDAIELLSILDIIRIAGEQQTGMLGRPCMVFESDVGRDRQLMGGR